MKRENNLVYAKGHIATAHDYEMAQRNETTV